MSGNKKNKKSDKQKEDGAFHSKNIKHDPQGESARAKFGKETRVSE
ncbi:hypothetical protein Cpap_3913 [Ruminiclostridium papyrosolvens DSM 2782]|uniref:Uncharacterized protein n=1 Tax=Ruminiclostridium papyrosolvens DSM 2782 TaxID=588581 RepID=F1T7M9_9FIRM|nr:CPC_1213 family protein [Ruminiclostridium papyrosolvens]EGD49477.1 hypothetical protein Cpap_3913 [Ruminiclostridium papyrosolvens DSM 2782]WES33398.1 CPC_1213 family protein [Ruminiclostridium papyrosolvens DSM 2782]